MSFRMSEMTMLRATDPRAFKKRVRDALIANEGRLVATAAALDVGVTTIKRWVHDDPTLQKVADRARKARV